MITMLLLPSQEFAPTRGKSTTVFVYCLPLPSVVGVLILTTLLRSCLGQLVGSSVDDVQWTQSSLPIRIGDE